MTNIGYNIVKKILQKEIAFYTPQTNYNRKRIGRLASKLYNDKSKCLTWGEAQKQVWNESRKTIMETRLELSAAKDRLMDLTTPEQKHETEDYKLLMMHKAHNQGENLNQTKI